MAITKADIRNIVRQIEELLNAEISLLPRRLKQSRAARRAEVNPAGGGRVIYVPLPGTGNRFKLSPRAQEVYSFLKRAHRASPQDLQAALKVNRNVIAGAVHELKAKRAITAQRQSMGPPATVAAEHVPRRRAGGRSR